MTDNETWQRFDPDELDIVEVSAARYDALVKRLAEAEAENDSLRKQGQHVSTHGVMLPQRVADALAEAEARAAVAPDRVRYEWVYEWAGGNTTTVTTENPDRDVYDGWNSCEDRRSHLRHNIRRVVVRTLHITVVDERTLHPGDLAPADPEGQP